MNRNVFFGMLGLTLLAALGLVFTFVTGRKGSSTDQYGDSIAKVTTVISDVQRKTADSMTWKPVESQDPLYVNDSVLTGEQSSAEITFQTGHVLNLGPTTLIVVRPPPRPEGPISLVLAQGQFQFRIAKAENLKINDMTIQFKGRALLIVEQSNNRSKLELVEGQADIVDAVTGTPVQAFQMGSPLMLGGEQEIPVETPPNIEKKISQPAKKIPIRKNQEADRIKSKIRGPKIVMRFPTPGTRYAAGNQIRMSWQEQSQVETYSWEIARDPDFAYVVDSGETFETEITVSNLPTGKLYWRVQGRDSAGLFVGEDEIWAIYISERQPATTRDTSTQDIPVNDLPNAKQIRDRSSVKQK